MAPGPAPGAWRAVALVSNGAGAVLLALLIAWLIVEALRKKKGPSLVQIFGWIVPAKKRKKRKK